jgi:transcriptional regulator with XRE-family HTH domain
MGLAKRLNGLRCGQGLTQAELCAAAGVSQYSISCYERGRRFPNARNLHRLADYFGVSPAWLSGSGDDIAAEKKPADDRWLAELVEEEARTSCEALAERLKKLREEAGASLGEVERVTGVCRRSLQSYESGTMYPGFASLVRMASYYGVSLDYLAGREN